MPGNNLSDPATFGVVTSASRTSAPTWLEAEFLTCLVTRQVAAKLCPATANRLSTDHQFYAPILLAPGGRII
jgi:hypothetical protein